MWNFKTCNDKEKIKYICPRILYFWKDNGQINIKKIICQFSIVFEIIFKFGRHAALENEGLTKKKKSMRLIDNV